MGAIALLIVGGLVVCLLVLVFNTVRYSSKQVTVPDIKPVAVNSDSAVAMLSQAVQFKTISHEDPKAFDPSPFIAFHQFLEKSYPNLHNTLRLKTINHLSLLYMWQGSDPELEPALLMAHQDVVPVEPETENKWSYDAFSGKIVDGYIWGRGTLDDKGCLIALMEAIEMLIKAKFKPRRTVYLAFGHDEEIGGQHGAQKIAAYLKKKDVRISFVIDEGLTILKKDLSPAKRKTALIGLSEKGVVTLKLTAKSESGHSSMPHRKTAIGTLARAVSRLEVNQMPTNIFGPAAKLFEFIGPEMALLPKILFANLWIFKTILAKQLEKINTTNALIRTTCAPTVIWGGVKENILPGQAHCFLNFRILPGDSISDVLVHAEKVINDPAIEVSIHNGAFDTEPSPLAKVDSFGFKTIRRTINEIFKDTIVAPGLVFGATDSRHYQSICENIYRFVPYNLGRADTHRIHGIDECISIEDYVKLIQFYTQLIRNCDGAK